MQIGQMVLDGLTLYSTVATSKIQITKEEKQLEEVAGGLVLWRGLHVGLPAAVTVVFGSLVGTVRRHPLQVAQLRQSQRRREGSRCSGTPLPVRALRAFEVD